MIIRAAAILLAAGSSRRFGENSKLKHRVAGEPLVLYAARALLQTPFVRRIAVTPPGDEELSGQLRPAFETIVNPVSREGVGTSLALAARTLLASSEADRLDVVIVALADMPCVPPEHFRLLVTRAASPGVDMVHSGSGPTSPHPPAGFRVWMLEKMAQLSGDAGAGSLARRLGDKCVSEPLGPDQLLDVDSLEDAARAQSILSSDGKKWDGAVGED